MNRSLVALAPLRLEARAVAAGAPGAIVERTGMGPRRAASAAERLRRRLSGLPVAVAVTGVGGALVDDLGPGAVVVADRVLRPSGEEVARLPAAGLLAAELRRAGLAVSVGAVVSTERLVAGRAGRAVLATTGAVAVDMESAALLDRPWGVPTAVVRAVSDRPGQELWSPATVTNGRRALRSLQVAAATVETWAAVTGPRRVLLAAPRSFCAGVERAIDTVTAALERFGTPVYVRRQIVHNDHVVATLEACGAVFVHELDEVPCGATVVFSAHGVAPDVRAAAAARRLRVIDATCPLVAKVHAEVRRFAEQGRQVVLIGHEGHDEVEGTVGEVPGVRLVATPDDVAALDLDDSAGVAYVTQTTLAPDDIDATIDALRRRFDDLVGPRTSDICYATQNRQDAVRSIAASCDLLLVVGSPASSNSRRLVEVGRRAGGRAELVATAADIRLEWLRDVRTVGLSAGASTPEMLVQGVLDALGALGPLDIELRPVRSETVSFPLPLEVR
jgi:4-hydroxy-3-methylbut-2-enyl diphosphate reductase